MQNDNKPGTQGHTPSGEASHEMLERAQRGAPDRVRESEERARRVLVEEIERRGGRR